MVTRVYLYSWWTYLAGWGATWSGGKARRSMCFCCSDYGRWNCQNRWGSGAGPVHGGLLWDADQVRARAHQTLQGSHALPSKDRVPVQISYHFFFRHWWFITSSPTPTLISMFLILLMFLLLGVCLFNVNLFNLISLHVCVFKDVGSGKVVK